MEAIPDHATGITWLSWTASDSSDVDHYCIYAGPGDCGQPPSPGLLWTTTTGLSAQHDDWNPDYDAPCYWVSAVDGAGNESEATAALQPTDAPSVPDRPRLEVSTHPNPFNPATTVRFFLEKGGRARLTAHDAAGRKVATLADATFPAGVNEVRWDGRDRRGLPLASGLYLLVLEAAGERVSAKVSVLK